MALEVRVVENAATGGLKIIDHIPPQRPCRLEGRNGIGKSALVRLLVLLSGIQPYPGEKASWRSLRTLVGQTIIRINGISGGYSSATVRLTPDSWPEEEPPESIGDWLGVLTLDGEEVPVQRLFELLDVVHLSGTERLIDTLKQQSGRLAVALSDVEGRLNDLEDQRAELGELDEQLKFISPREAETEKARWGQVATERRQVEADLQTAKPVADDLGRATALTALVETGDAAEHQRRLQELRDQLQLARQRMEAAETIHNDAVAALAQGTAAQRQVATRERRLGVIGKTMDRLSARQEELGALLESLHIPADVDLLADRQQTALDNAFEPLLERQRHLQVLAARSHRTSAENRLLDDVRVILDDAVEAGLGSTVLARLNDQEITVTDLRDGLGFHTGVNDNDLEDLAATTRDLAKLAELKELFTRRATLHNEVTRLRLELERLEPKAAGQDELREKAAEARGALDTASAEVRSYMTQIGALSRSTLGGADVDDVEAHIRNLLAKHGVEETNLSTALLEAQMKVSELQTRGENLQTEIERLSASATRRRVLRETLRRRSESDESLKWLRQLAAMITPAIEMTTDSTDWSDETWQGLAEHVAAFRKALSKLATDVSGMQTLARQLPSPATTRLAIAIKALVEADARTALSAQPIADALFGGGKVRRVNLDDESITWTTPSNEARTRPLAAFSSGEQALGFMRARLQQIADHPAANRLVFLDEFGAFISADRRRPLADLLTSEELRALAEQVVVVLPLQSDYANELDQTTGALHDLYAERADAVKAHGYFTEVFIG
jgi:hypothetical protein